MKLHILTVSNRQPDWVLDGSNEYMRRMPRELSVLCTEIKPEVRNGRSPEQLMAAEKTRIRAALPTEIHVVALDERGADLSTEKLAQRLQTWMQGGQDVAFLLGGADGLDPELKAQAKETIRLSSLTLPHGLARLLLCEQLYRAASLLKNHPYHRA